MNNGTSTDVIEDFNIKAKLDDSWSHNQHYQNYFIKTLRSGLKMLDIGCGNGELTRKIKPFSQSVLGIDVSDKMIEEARRRNSSEAIKYENIDFESFYNDNSEKFDAIFCIAALHHMNEEEALRMMKDMLIEKGKLYILDLYKEETISDYLIIGLGSIYNKILMLIKRHRWDITAE